MTTRALTTAALALGLLVTANDRASAQGFQRADQSGYAGSLDARQHGYEHAYRDGADRGRMDRERDAGYHPQNADSRNATYGYEPYFGNKMQYIQGYRDGYKAGYDDGYNGQPGRYGQVYSRRPNDDTYEPSREDAYTTRGFPATDVAFDSGYRDGITLGQRDQTRRDHGDYHQADAYRSADFGYRSSYGDRATYQQQFRDGFERGYQDAYGRSRYPGDTGGGNYPNGGNGNGGGRTYDNGNGSRSAQNMAPATVTVPGNRQWTSTIVRVSDGEVLRFQSTGEIAFTNTNDRAGVAGSPALKYVPGAPIPGALAGALIGRIDNGQPFGIGDQASIRMPASGTLYLGINDDNVGDNSGEFHVIISR